jgi:orotate phosphoribosyltransferase
MVMVEGRSIGGWGADMEGARLRLLELVRELAWLESEDEPFTLASGRKSPHFFDMKPVMLDPEGAALLGQLIVPLLTERGITKIGGLELGAVPLTGTVIGAVGPDSAISGFIVRKSAKGRGGRKTGNPPGIEGATLNPSDRVMVLEDVTTTGASAIQAAQRLRKIGCDVVGILTILDRDEGGREAIEAEQFEHLSLLSLSDVKTE